MTLKDRHSIEDLIISLHGIAGRLESNPLFMKVGMDIRNAAEKLSTLSKQLNDN